MKFKERLHKEISPREYWIVLNSFGAAISLYLIVGGSGISYETMGVPLFILLATSIGCPIWAVCRKISLRYKEQVETFERKAETLLSKCIWLAITIGLFCYFGWLLSHISPIWLIVVLLAIIAVNTAR